MYTPVRLGKEGCGGAEGEEEGARGQGAPAEACTGQGKEYQIKCIFLK